MYILYIILHTQASVLNSTGVKMLPFTKIKYGALQIIFSYVYISTYFRRTEDVEVVLD